MVTETSMDAQTPANSGAFGPSASETVARSPTGRQPTGWRTGRIAKTFFLVACGLIFGGGLSFLMAQFRTPQPEPNTTVQTIPAAGRIGAASLAVAAEKRDEDDAAGLAGPPLSDNALTAAEPKAPARVPQTERAAALGQKARLASRTRRPTGTAARSRATRNRTRTPDEHSGVLGWLRRAKNNVLLRNQRVDGERKKKRKAPCKCATSPTRMLVPGFCPAAFARAAIGRAISSPLLRA